MSNPNEDALLKGVRELRVIEAPKGTQFDESDSTNKATVICMLNSDLCRSIASYCDCDVLLQLEQVNFHWLNIVTNQFRCMLQLPEYKYLTFNRRRFSDTSAKRLCCRIANRRKKDNDAMFLLGGSYQSTSKVTCTLSVSADISAVESLPASLPQDLSCRASTMDSEGNLLLLGGYSDLFSTSINTVRCMNLREPTSSWCTLAPLCNARCYGAAVTTSSGDLLHIGGGESPYQGGACFADCYICKTGENNWQEHVVPDMNNVRCGHSAVVFFDDSIIVTGGYAGGTTFHSSVELLSTHLDRWISLPSMSESRSGMAAVLGPCGSVYVAGGSPNGIIGHKSTERFDPREGKWIPLADMHVGRGYTTSCLSVCESGFYVLGGIDTWVYSENMEFYDFRMNRWVVKEAKLEMRALLGRATAHLIPDF